MEANVVVALTQKAIELMQGYFLLEKKNVLKLYQPAQTLICFAL
jgi:hypothetical protein